MWGSCQEQGCPAAAQWHGDSRVPTTSRGDERTRVLTPGSSEGPRAASPPASCHLGMGVKMEMMEMGTTLVTPGLRYERVGGRGPRRGLRFSRRLRASSRALSLAMKRA